MSTTAEEPTSATPRFRWLDRWLESRWRALLTWGALSVLAMLMNQPPYVTWIFTSVRFTQRTLLSNLPLALPAGQLSTAAVISTLSILKFWFWPVILRVGLARTLVWIGAGVICYLVLFMSGYPFTVRPLNAPTVVAYVIIFGLPGLAVVGRRTRPWMALVAGVASAAWINAYYSFLIRFVPLGLDLHVVEVPITSLLYGAVMLYGTEPLPRRSAERQLDDDQR